MASRNVTRSGRSMWNLRPWWGVAGSGQSTVTIACSRARLRTLTTLRDGLGGLARAGQIAGRSPRATDRARARAGDVTGRSTGAVHAGTRADRHRAGGAVTTGQRTGLPAASDAVVLVATTRGAATSAASPLREITAHSRRASAACAGTGGCLSSTTTDHPEQSQTSDRC